MKGKIGACTLFVMIISIASGVIWAKEDIASTKEVSKVMAEAWCQKLEECDANGEMGPRECHKVLHKSFQDGFKNTAGQKVQVSKKNLEQCSESIKSNTCDGLKAAQTLPGCSFIGMLNRY